MAIYKHPKDISKSDHTAFDATHRPGEKAPYSGIYRCDSCGFEATSEEGNPLPPARTCGQHHTRWKCRGGEVTWRLVVYAVHTNDT